MSHASPPRNDRDAEHYEDLLASAAFGTLNSDEAAELREYLAANPGAREILAEMRELASGLPLLIDEVEPSADLRGRIERSIVAPEGARPGFLEDDNSITPLQFPAQPEPARLHVPHPAWNASLLAAAAALVIALAAGVVLGRYFFADTSEEPTPESIAYEMTPSTPMPDMTAELTYDPDTQLFMLETENMPHAPEGMVYQVWLIDKNNVPQPEGVMDEPSFAVTANRDEYAAFAITVEPGPLGSEAPTSQPFFVAPLTPAAES